MVLSASTVIAARLVQEENAEPPILVTLDEIVTPPDLPPGHCMSVVWFLL